MGGHAHLGAALAAVLATPAFAQLSIVGVTLHQYEGGPPLPSDFRFGRGETVFVRGRIQGFTKSAQARVHLICSLDALDPRDIPLLETLHKQIETELAPQDKDWVPVVQFEFMIPPLGEPGRYKIVLRAEDKLAGRQARAEIPFFVRGPVVEPSDTLVARNFRFLRTEDGPVIEEPAVYSRGERLWARFEITGYKIGQNNRIEVDYGLSVLGPTGKEVYSEPQAAVERSTPYYPHRYLPGILSLDLERAQPGAYTLMLQIRDRVGGQQYESRHSFQVR